MSAETDYFMSWVTAPTQVSMTTTSSQGATQPRGGAWRLGITGFGWSNLGSRIGDPPAGLAFSSHVWFSDRVVNRQVPAVDWQQFSASASDREVRRFTVAGDHVQLENILLRWGNATWRANSFMFDTASQQLLFRVPGAGPSAPPAILLVSFATGAGIL